MVASQKVEGLSKKKKHIIVNIQEQN